MYELINYGLPGACLDYQKWRITSKVLHGAGKPPPGLHLDVLKGDKLVESLIIDEQKFYLFGSDPEVCDFTIGDQSCSQVQCAGYHKHLERALLIDLNSTHGAFLGQIRLEPHKPQQDPLHSTVSFEASTGMDVRREKSQTQGSAAAGELEAGEDEELKRLLGLPEEETELKNLTGFNTTRNEHITTLTIEEGNLTIQRPKRRRRSCVSFSDEDEIINPEDVDSSVGCFRNMIQTAVVPVMEKKTQGHRSLDLDAIACSKYSPPVSGGLYGDLPSTSHEAGAEHHIAPDVDVTPAPSVEPQITLSTPVSAPHTSHPLNEPCKKKYAKEVWPGKKPTISLLM